SLTHACTLLQCALLYGALLGPVPGFAQTTTQPRSSAAMNDAGVCPLIRGNNLYVRLNAGRIQTSADGLIWLDRSAAIRTFLRGITYGNGVFVAVGGSHCNGSGVILTSRDGIAWLPQNFPNDVILYSVTCAQDLFVAVG